MVDQPGTPQKWAPPPPAPAGHTPHTPHGAAIATVGQRIAARAIDLAVCLPVLMVLFGLEAVVRSVTGVAASETDSDWVSSMLGLLVLAIGVSYDPVATSLFRGATPGKRATGRRVVRWDDGTLAGGMVLWGRNTLLVLEWLFVVPGIVDLVRAAKSNDGRTWVDRATGTAVVTRSKDAAAMPASPAASTWRPEPWASLVAEAAEARRRLGRAVAQVSDGPLRERLDDVCARVAACEAECIRVADRGVQLSTIVADSDLDALGSRHQLAAVDPSKDELIEAYGRELASAERLVGLVGTTQDRLQQLVAEMNSAVNTGIEIALAPSNDVTFDALLDQLDGLRTSLEAVEREAGPREI